MAGVGSSIARVNTAAALYNVTPINDVILLTTANTEYSYALPADCIGFMLSGRTNFKMKLAYNVNGTQGSIYKTLQPGVTFTDEHYYQAQTIYVSADINNAVAELICWSIIP